MESGSHVTPQHSRELIEAVERIALERHNGDRTVGLYGPASITWQVNREAALFLGAGRAALLQLAHPWVATALEQHSSLMANPIGRFHSTFRIVFAMIFGSLDQALAAAEHLYRLHTHVTGELDEAVGAWPAGSPYEANEVPALLWVYATLVESAVLAYEVVLPPLSAGQLESYYAESKTLARLFGLAPAELPATWADFQAYCRAMEASPQLGVTTGARRMGQSLLAGAGSWVKPPMPYRALTTEWLAPRLREEFALGFTGREAGSAQRAREWLRRVYPRLPQAIRFVGPWHEAQARLARRRPSLLSGPRNRFWIGEGRLPFAS